MAGYSLPMTLSTYIGKRFLANILLALGILIAIIMLMDLFELIRRASSRDHVTFAVIVEMSLLKLPSMLERILPFSALIGGILALTRLTRTHELVVARAAGVSVWQFLLPALILVFGIGVFSVTIFNPLSAAMLSRYEQMEGKYFSNKLSLLSVNPSGLWLRQLEEDNPDTGERLIHALRVSQKDMMLSHVIVFTFDRKQHFSERLDAETAKLENGKWILSDVLLTSPGRPAERFPTYELKTELTQEQIQDSFASPRTMPFWQLPGFINTLEKAGFSGLRHRLYWHSLLATQLMLCAMILIAATFSLRQTRQGRVGLLIAMGILVGFGMYFMTNLVSALGASGALPVEFAAWSPAVITVMLGVMLLLHLEDG